MDEEKKAQIIALAEKYGIPADVALSSAEEVLAEGTPQPSIMQRSPLPPAPEGVSMPAIRGIGDILPYAGDIASMGASAAKDFITDPQVQKEAAGLAVEAGLGMALPQVAAVKGLYNIGKVAGKSWPYLRRMGDYAKLAALGAGGSQVGREINRAVGLDKSSPQQDLSKMGWDATLNLAIPATIDTLTSSAAGVQKLFTPTRTGLEIEAEKAIPSASGMINAGKQNTDRGNIIAGELNEQFDTFGNAIDLGNINLNNPSSALQNVKGKVAAVKEAAVRENKTIIQKATEVENLNAKNRAGLEETTPENWWQKQLWEEQGVTPTFGSSGVQMPKPLLQQFDEFGNPTGLAKFKLSGNKEQAEAAALIEEDLANFFSQPKTVQEVNLKLQQIRQELQQIGSWDEQTIASMVGNPSTTPEREPILKFVYGVLREAQKSQIEGLLGKEAAEKFAEANSKAHALIDWETQLGRFQKETGQGWRPGSGSGAVQPNMGLSPNKGMVDNAIAVATNQSGRGKLKAALREQKALQEMQLLFQIRHNQIAPRFPRRWDAIKNNRDTMLRFNRLAVALGVNPEELKQDGSASRVAAQMAQVFPNEFEPSESGFASELNGKLYSPIDVDTHKEQSLDLPDADRALVVGNLYDQNKYVSPTKEETLPTQAMSPFSAFNLLPEPKPAPMASPVDTDGDYLSNKFKQTLATREF